MMSSVRQEVLQVLAELSEVVPEVRLGQLIVNLSYLGAACPTNPSGTWKMTNCWPWPAGTWRNGALAAGRC